LGRTRLLTNVGNPSSLQVKREQFLQGWLAGKGNRAVCAYSVPNASENPERDFRMEAEAQLSAMLEIRETGLDLTATYHSHPRGGLRQRPGAGGLPDSFHLIVSLANGRPEIRCYCITEQEGCRQATLSIERAYRGRGTPRCS
jgi:hypothetical protein